MAVMPTNTPCLTSASDFLSTASTRTSSASFTVHRSRHRGLSRSRSCRRRFRSCRARARCAVLRRAIDDVRTDKRNGARTDCPEFHLSLLRSSNSPPWRETISDVICSATNTTAPPQTQLRYPVTCVATAAEIGFDQSAQFRRYRRGFCRTTAQSRAPPDAAACRARRPCADRARLPPRGAASAPAHKPDRRRRA